MCDDWEDMPRDDAVCSTQGAVKCLKCGQPLEPWEAGLCEGCGNVNKKTAEIFSSVSDFLCEVGQWSAVCDFLHEKGFSPSQIANAFNDAASHADITSNLRASDCE